MWRAGWLRQSEKYPPKDPLYLSECSFPFYLSTPIHSASANRLSFTPPSLFPLPPTAPSLQPPLFFSSFPLSVFVSKVPSENPPHS